MNIGVTRRARLLLALVGLLLVAGVALAAPATAHASLIATDPADGQVLPEAPEAISMTFTENVRLTDSIELLSGDGTPVEADVSVADAVVTITPADLLEDGTYIVGWRVISADTHPVAGGFSFSVGAPSTTSVDLPTTAAPRDVDLLRKSAEAARYGGVLLAAGLLPFIVLLAPSAVRASTRLRRNLNVTAKASAVVAVVGAALLAPLTAMWQAASPLSSFGSVVVDPATWQTDTGVAALVLAGSLATALAAVRRAPALALSAATVAVGSLAIVGHTRTFGPVPLMLTADLLHVVVAAVWLGGLVGLTFLFLAGRDVPAAPAQAAVRRFSTTALVSVGILAASGVVLWWRVPATVTGLPDTSYGVHLIVKIALVVVVVAIAAWNLRHLRSHRTPDLARLRRTVAAELGVVAAVVATTAGLVTQVPRVVAPVSTEAATEPAEVEQALDLGPDLTTTLVLTPGGVGTSSAQLTVTDADGEPVTALEPPQISVGISEYDLGPFRHELLEVAPGQYEGSLDLPIAGTWRVEVAVRVSSYERPSDAFELEVSE